MSAKKIVIIGGGAGGLELAALLSKKLKTNEAELTLVDGNLKHVWKPLLHEVATGTLSTHEDELGYIPYANKMGFHFILGRMEKIDRVKKEVLISPVQESGIDLIPARTLQYDILVIAIGSLSNDFNIPGVREHCLFLDNLNQAEIVQKILVNNIIQQVQHHSPEKPLNVAIIGAGATGVELAAEIHHAIKQGKSYSSLPTTNPTHIKLIEGRNRITPQMPERVSMALTKYLGDLGIEVIVGEQISSVTQEGFNTADAKIIVADIKIWSAGIKADNVLKNSDGLEVNALNQLVVKKTLQTTLDDSIFAFGDCASCLQNENQDKKVFVPPTAQAAHQQAILLAKSLVRMLRGQSLLDFKYNDYGSLVTVSNYKIVGSLMGKFSNSIYIEGKFARLLYHTIHKKHQIALHGYWRVLLVTLANLLTRKGRSRLKLH
jgi:NADH dehydrogenase